MKADLSRNSFAKNKHYTSVRQQQGRIFTDADWNEQNDIALDRDRRFSIDVLNSDGAPVDGGGFAIQVIDDGGQENLHVASGRYYVNGLLAENESDVLYTAQPDLPGATLPADDGVYLAYLDAWERPIDHLDDPGIREEALNGADTAYRVQTIAQTKLIRIDDNGTVVPPATPPTAWSDITDRVLPGLTARALPAGTPDTSCDGGGYTGLDNALYRIEIHKSGPPDTATFKWSRSNAGLAHEWESQDGNELTIRALLQNSIAPELKAGDWVEVTDAGLELENRRGTLVRLAQVDSRVLTIDPATAIHFDSGVATLDIADFSRGTRKIRPWDMSGPGGADGEIVVEASVWTKIEAGIEVRFDSADYQSGDYWTIPARSTTRSIAWPCETGVGPVTRTAAGIKHNYAQLAFLENSGGDWTLLRDCRRQFASRTNSQLIYVSGSGQEAMPGQSLPAPIEVRVTRGDRPVAGARVQFTIITGSGVLSDAGATVSGATIMLAADADGLVSVNWDLDAITAAQKVRATLLDAVDTGLPATIEFVANQSIATRVAYDTVAGGDTVEDVLDRLGSDKINRAGDTVTGSLIVQENLEVKGVLNAQGDVLANAQNVAGDIQLGNQDEDQVRFYGEIDSAHSSGMLEVADDLRVREDLIVDGKIGVNTPVNDAALTVGGAIESKSGGYRFPDGTIQTTAGDGGDSIPSGLSLLGESELPPSGYVYTGTRIETEDPNGFRTWTARANLPVARSDVATEVLNGQIYMIGGSESAVGAYVNTALRYDPALNDWEPIAAMSTVRGGAASAVLDGKIHVMTGYVDLTNRTATHEAYDPILNTWEFRESASIVRSFARAATIQGKIYLIGGWTTGFVVQSLLEEYDPDTDMWTEKEPMKEPRSVTGVAVHNDLLYVMGGQGPGSAVYGRVEVYDPVQDQWSDRAPMPTAKHAFGVSVICDKIITFGGQLSGGADLQAVQVYDPKTDHWEVLEDLPAPTRSPGWASVGGVTYVIGGAAGTPVLSTTYARSFPVPYYLHAKSPAPGDGGRLQVLGTDWTHAKLSWTKASNANGPASALTYRAYYSTEDNIGNVADIDANGTAAGEAHADIDSITIAGLESGRVYYINVLVEIGSANRAAYIPARVEIPFEWKWLDGKNINGINVVPAANAARADSDGYFSKIATAWEENANIRARSFDGLGWSPLETGGIDTGGGSQHAATISFRGRLFVAYNEANRTRVNAYDGDRWISVDGGPLSLTGQSAWGQKFEVYNDRLYLGWHEDNTNTNLFQIRLMRYEGGSSWSQLDGDGNFASLNYSIAGSASMGNIVGWRGRIYIGWAEFLTPAPAQIRVRALSDGGSWTFVDGGGPTGLNFNVNEPAFGGMLAVYRDELYCSFYEERSGIFQLRVKKYDGSRWAFVDGGLSTGLNFDIARTVFLEGIVVANDRLFVSWTEQAPGGSDQARVAHYDGEVWRFSDGGSAIGLNENPTRTASHPRIAVVNDRAVLPFVEYVSGSGKIRVREAGPGEAALPAPRQSHSTAVVNGRIYVIGGSAVRGQPQTTNYEYDPQTRQWTRRAPVPTVARWSTPIAVVNNRIHYFQGSALGSVIVNNHDVYDPATDTWTTAAPFPFNGDVVTAAGAIGDRIYACEPSSTVFHVYDANTDLWSTLANTASAYSRSIGAVLNGKFYRIGGRNSGGTNLARLDEYNPATNQWTPLENMSTARVLMGVTVANGKIYVLGGETTNETPRAEFEEYDPLTNNWRSLNNIPVAANHIAAEVVGDTIYSIGGEVGGESNGNSVRDVHAHRLLLDWRNAAPLPEAHSACPVVVLNGKIHLIGSYRETGAFAATHTVYDPTTESSTTLAPLPEALAYAFAAVIDGKIYYFGGSDVTANTDTYVYDPGTDSWSTVAPIPTGHFISLGGVINDKVYIVGDGDQVLHVYDPGQDNWTVLTAMPRPHVAGMSAVLNNQLYIIGGTNATVNAHELLVDIYDPDTDDWTIGEPLPDGRYGAGSFAHNDEIYLLGGYEGVSGFPVRRNSCLKLDPERGAWVNLPPLTDEHSHYKPVVVNDTIYALGGRQAVANNNSRRVEKLSLNELAPYSPVPTALPFLLDWDLRADLPGPRAEPMVAEVAGKFYVFGGQSSFNVFEDDSFVFDPVTNAWNTISPMTIPRSNGVAAAVNGKIYVMAGISDLNEVYDPATDSWDTRAPVPEPRSNHGVAVLDGLIYLLGGAGTALARNDAYDPAQDIWDDSLADIPTPRTTPMCAALNGKIYVIGGTLANNSRTGVVQAYDPVADDWDTNLAQMPTPRSDAAVSVVSGKIVIAGGVDGSTDYATIEAYDPIHDTWTTLSPMSQGRNAVESLVFGRTMFVMGGVNTNTLEYFATNEAISIPETQTLAPLPTAIASGITETINGKIYTGFGITSLPDNFTGDLREYDPVSDSWTDKEAGSARFGAASAVLNGKLYVFGGATDGSSHLTTNEVYDPATDSWTDLKLLNTAARESTACAGPDGRIYLFGGLNTSSDLNTAEAYDPVADTWEAFLGLPEQRRQARAVLFEGRIHLFGGTNTNTTLARHDVYDPVANSYSSRQDLPVPLTNGAATVLNGRLYYLGGWNPPNRSRLIYEYNPQTDTWRTVGSLAQAVYSTAAVTIGSRIYLPGGFDETDTTRNENQVVIFEN